MTDMVQRGGEGGHDRAFDRGAADLADRLSLTRVAGIVTDLSDLTEVEYRALRLERVILVGVGPASLSPEAVGRSFAELQLLAETAGSQVLNGITQRRAQPDPATYLGRGKVAELAELVKASAADTVICDGELSPAQLRNLEDQVGVKVIDRTALILDIFAQHAKSREGQAQVELAQLQYLRQRLRGWGGNLSRQVGGRASGGVGIGGRGPGETRLETDRRRINTRIARLKAQLDQMAATRQVARAERVRHRVASVAIVGYTNAGKSSLLNALTQAEVLVNDALFATLDPTTRRATSASGRVFTLTDTVGFIRRLPTDLVAAFASTLEESVGADLLLHVVDGSDPDPAGQIEAVHQVLRDVGAGDVTELIAINKTDLLDPARVEDLSSQFPQAELVSVRTGFGLAELWRRLDQLLPRPLRRVVVLLPYDRGDLLDRLHRQGDIESVEHVGDGSRVTAWVDQALAGLLQPYLAVVPPGADQP